MDSYVSQMLCEACKQNINKDIETFIKIKISEWQLLVLGIMSASLHSIFVAWSLYIQKEYLT